MKIKNEKSFTLLEAIVAIFVITTGLVGVLSLVTQTISSATFSKDKLIAAYLAQEGIEVIRNIRDTNWLEGAVWDDGLGGGDWQTDYDDPGLTSCPSPCDYGSSNLLFLKIDGGFYNYAVGTDTKFKRKITIIQPQADILEVVVSVEWQEKGNPYSLEVQENLYNWK